MANACAAIDVIGADNGARKLLHDVVGLITRPARRAGEHDGVRAILFLDGLQARTGEVDGFIPRYCLELAAALTAYHWLLQARGE